MLTQSFTLACLLASTATATSLTKHMADNTNFQDQLDWLA